MPFNPVEWWRKQREREQILALAQEWSDILSQAPTWKNLSPLPDGMTLRINVMSTDDPEITTRLEDIHTIRIDIPFKHIRTYELNPQATDIVTALDMEEAKRLIKNEMAKIPALLNHPDQTAAAAASDPSVDSSQPIIIEQDGNAVRTQHGWFFKQPPPARTLKFETKEEREKKKSEQGPER